MGLYPINCPQCGAVHQWFSGNLDQRCSDCQNGKIFFTSDQHYWHANVIRYCGRPHATTEQMNEDLVAKWNSVVTIHDTVFNLGDFSLAFRPVEIYPQRLLGRKILVPGNHDFCHSYHKKSRSKENQEKWLQKYRDNGFIVLPEQTTLDIPGVANFNLCHHPYSDGGDNTGDGYSDKYNNWRPTDDGKILLCGHVHEKWQTKRSPKGTLMINVGVDVHGMKPVSLDEIVQIIARENGAG